jgi:5'-nucleotidase / UDP-sugar diphosphatase
VSFMPGVGYGVTLHPGPITREALYTMIPHPAPLVTLEMSGEQILATLEQTATNLNPRSSREVVGGLVQTSGVRYTLDLTQPLGQRVRDVRIGDEPIDRQRAYPVVTNGGLLNGIHHYTAFAEGRNIERTEMIVTEVVEEGLRQMGIVHAPAMGEVTLIRES